MKLEGARCLVTGCSSGLGRALVEALAEEGAHVLATARRCESIADLEGDDVELHELDVTDDARVRSLVERVTPLDLLVNNAGYGLFGAVEEISDTELYEQYETNFFGPWRLCRAVLPGMRGRARGMIVNISSFAGRVPFPEGAAYRSSKYALEGLSGCLYFEVGHFGIRVLSVQLGDLATGFSRSLRRPGAQADGAPYAPMREDVDRVFPLMCPSRLPPDKAAHAILEEIKRDSGPLRITIGEDAARLIALGVTGDDAYERYVVDELGFAWHRRATPGIKPTSP